MSKKRKELYLLRTFIVVRVAAYTAPAHTYADVYKKTQKREKEEEKSPRQRTAERRRWRGPQEKCHDRLLLKSKIYILFNISTAMYKNLVRTE